MGLRRSPRSLGNDRGAMSGPMALRKDDAALVDDALRGSPRSLGNDRGAVPGPVPLRNFMRVTTQRSVSPPAAKRPPAQRSNSPSNATGGTNRVVRFASPVCDMSPSL